MRDANGTRFHLVLGPDDWTAGHATDTEFDPRADALRLRGVPHRVRLQPGDRNPRRADRRTPAADRFGSIYWLSDDHRAILVQPADSILTDVLWSAALTEPDAPDRVFRATADEPNATAPRLDALTVTDDHLLVAASAEMCGLLVFDLRAPGPPILLAWPPGIGFHPTDMAARAGGGAYLVEGPQRRLWELDRWLRVVPPLPIEPRIVTAAGFAPTQATPNDPNDAARLADVPLTDGAFPLPVTVTAVEAFGNDALVVGESGTVHLIRRDTSGSTTAALIGNVDHGHDMAVLDHDRTLAVVHPDGNQLIIYQLAPPTGGVGQPSLTELADQYLLRRYDGRGAVRLGNEVWYSSAGTWVPAVRLRQIRYATHGTIDLGPFDGRDPGCTWHRLFVEGRIPSGTSITIEAAAADDPAELAQATWVQQPTPVAEHTALRPERTESSHTPILGMLFQQVEGRYLSARLHLRGDGRVSPSIKSLRLWYPRYSYTTSLPAAWRTEPAAASLLERLLAIFELELTAIEDRIALMRLMIDARTADPTALEWIVSWLGLGFDEAWPTAMRRRFLQLAPIVLQRRGTRAGVLLAMRLVLCPEMSEHDLLAGETPADPRIVEEFMSIPQLGRSLVAAGDRTIDEDRLTRNGLWEPPLGAGELIRRWNHAGGTGTYPVVTPTDPSAAARWREFSRAVLGFVPSAADADTVAWEQFLTSTHGSALAARAVGWGDTADPTMPTMPTVLPTVPRALADWYEFERIVVSRRRAGHRFRVLLPLPDGYADGRVTDRQLADRIAVVSKAVDRVRPVHTAFSVDWFRSAFLVGRVRLGTDTIIERQPIGYPAAIEGRTAESMGVELSRPLVLLRTGTPTAPAAPDDSHHTSVPPHGAFHHRRPRRLTGPERSRL